MMWLSQPPPILFAPWGINPCRITAQPSYLPAVAVVGAPVAVADPVVVAVVVAVAGAPVATAASAMPVRASTADQAGPPVAGATMPGLVRELAGQVGLP